MVLLEIARNCDYLKAECDDVIITQGDDGDRWANTPNRMLGRDVNAIKNRNKSPLAIEVCLVILSATGVFFPFFFKAVHHPVW